MHLVHHVDAVHVELGALGQAQRHVQHAAVLGGVDAVATEHRVAASGKVHLRGQRDERVAHLLVQVVARQVNGQVTGTQGELLGPIRLLGKPLAEIDVEAAMQVFELSPRGRARGINR